MSIRTCPSSAQSGSVCPSGRLGPRGCAFAAFQPNYGASTIYTDVRSLYTPDLAEEANRDRIWKIPVSFTKRSVKP
jgi:hypothetical protein